MKTIKLKNSEGIPQGYTGIIEWEDGDKGWYKNGNRHREDGPSYVSINNIYKAWWLDGKIIWSSYDKLYLTNKIILSKSQHSEYPTVQVWKFLDSDRVYERIIIPGMEEHIKE